MRHKLTRGLAAVAVSVPILALAPSGAGASSGSPGDDQITITINDSYAGGSYDEDFEKAYAGQTPDGTDVYVYVPIGALGADGTGDPTVDSVNPAFDPNPGDGIDPCVENAQSDHVMTQDQITALGDELSNQIVRVDEEHFGEIGLADPTDPSSDAMVVLAYNVQDDSYYDCAEDTYTAGYFAPEYIDDAGMNVIVIDSFDWATRVGEPELLYEGVIAHELEHLLMNYSDPGELSWVDEGLADMAIFLNGYPAGGSHFTYHQVFHRETSLTRWGGGLENYGASWSYFLYLWEQAGGNGDSLTADTVYQPAGGDLLIKKIFADPADGMAGVQAAIDAYNAETGSSLRSAEDLFKDWAIAIYLDAEGDPTFDFANLDFGDPNTTTWTIELANDVFYEGRGQYQGAMPGSRFEHDKSVPDQTALPYGTSYETFRNPGPVVTALLDGDDTTTVAAHTGDTHLYGGYESQSDNVLGVDTPVVGGETLDFWTWYFIEEGWDYGFVEALVGTDWVTIPLVNDSGVIVTTNDDPHDANEEGNGITGTSGGAYFVDDPAYIHLTATLPAGASDVRFRYSTDAAYLDTGWFVDDVSIDGAAAALDLGDWTETTGAQDNNWVLQVYSPCDLTPGVDSTFETATTFGYLYRLEGDRIEQGGLATGCLRTSKDSIVVAISNLPTGDLTFLDAGYEFRLTNAGNGKAKKK